MAATSSIEWNTENTSSLVSIGTHSLFVSTHGIPRTSLSQPIVLLLSGVAGTLVKWPALIRALSSDCRILAYDRSGMGRSEQHPNATQPTMDTIAGELHALLNATHVRPPYVLLGHSWGGMLATWFASTFSNPRETISGFVFLDAGAPSQDTDRHGSHKDFTTDPGSPWSHPSVTSVIQGLDVLRSTAPPEKCALTDEEYQYLTSSTSTPEHYASAKREYAALQDSYVPFQSLNLFGFDREGPPVFSSIPIATVHAHAYAFFMILWAQGHAARNGTCEERQDFLRLLKTWSLRVMENQLQFLSLTDVEIARPLKAKEDAGHDVMMMDVEACVEAVRWVLERAKEKQEERR